MVLSTTKKQLSFPIMRDTNSVFLSWRFLIKIFQKLEREEERKKKIAEKLAAGKIVGQNKREKGKTAYIEHYIGPNGEIDWNKSNVEKPVDYSKPTKVRINTEPSKT